MPNACSNFLRNQDSLSLRTSFYYKKEPTFGTIAGGCASFSLNMFSFIFIFAQLYGLIFDPDYN